MHVTRVELDNIKSYEREAFDFQRGTTAIVGPNGAGKTTILEAIAWALFDVLDYSKEEFLRRGAKKGSVRVTFESDADGRSYTVYRDTGNGYYIHDPGLGAKIAEKKQDVSAMLRQLLSEGETVVLARGGEAVGFSIVRRFGRGHAIGPVVAPDLAGAQALISHWCSRYAGKFLRIDVDAASGLPEWLEAQSLPRVGTVTTMVRNGPLERGPAVGGWALVTQAIG
jgi:hypothetical protein